VNIVQKNGLSGNFQHYRIYLNNCKSGLNQILAGEYNKKRGKNPLLFKEATINRFRISLSNHFSCSNIKFARLLEFVSEKISPG